MAKIEAFKSRVATLADDTAADEFYRPAAVPKLRASRLFSPSRGKSPGNAAVDDAEAREAHDREEEAFLRSRRRVPVRRGWIKAGLLQRLGVLFGALGWLLSAGTLAYGARYFLQHDARFRIPDSSSIQIAGNGEVTRAQLLSIFGDDVDNNIFAIPLEERRAELERLPWVEHATLMRLLPNQLRLSIVERKPIAFVRTGNEIGLVDRNGVLLTMSTEAMTAHHYSFPVVSGITQREPLSTRAARMGIYQKFLSDLDSGGATRISDQLSEIDLSDPEDVKAVLPAEGSDILAHFGQERFLARYKNFKAHSVEWRQQYPHLAAVDLRYDQQVVLQMAKGNEVAADSDAADAGRAIEADAPAPSKDVQQASHPRSRKITRPMARHRRSFSFKSRLPARHHREQP